MANFDTSLSNDSYVKFCEDGNADDYFCDGILANVLEFIYLIAKSFHVYWERVLLQNKPEVGPFTFSASLYDDGDIVFGYYFLPIDIANIEDGKQIIHEVLIEV
jgi:hypothetical protein